jgi:hypothetical protein
VLLARAGLRQEREPSMRRLSKGHYGTLRGCAPCVYGLSARGSSSLSIKQHTQYTANVQNAVACNVFGGRGPQG